MTLNLVKGDFTELEDALRAQVQKLEEGNNRLEEKVFLLDQGNKLQKDLIDQLEAQIVRQQVRAEAMATLRDGMRETIDMLREEFDTGYKKPSWVSSPKPSDE